MTWQISGLANCRRDCLFIGVVILSSWLKTGEKYD